MRAIDRMLRPFQNGPLAIALAAVWIFLVLYTNSLPADRLPDLRSVWYKPPHADKVVHFTFYGVMAALLFNAIAPSLKRPGWHIAFRRALVIGLLVPMVLGVGDELHQLRVPGRAADVWDVAANWLGAFTAVTLASRKWRPTRHQGTQSSP